MPSFPVPYRSNTTSLSQPRDYSRPLSSAPDSKPLIKPSFSSSKTPTNPSIPLTSSTPSSSSSPSISPPPSSSSSPLAPFTSVIPNSQEPKAKQIPPTNRPLAYPSKGFSESSSITKSIPAPLSSIQSTKSPLTPTGGSASLKEQSYLLLREVGPALIKEFGPPIAHRVGPPLARRLGPTLIHNVGLPLAKRVGLPLAKRVALPLVKRFGGFLLHRIGF